MLTKIYHNEKDGKLVRVFIDLNEVVFVEKYLDDEILITLKSGKERRLVMEVDDFMKIYNKEMNTIASPCPG